MAQGVCRRDGAEERAIGGGDPKLEILRFVQPQQFVARPARQAYKVRGTGISGLREHHAREPRQVGLEDDERPAADEYRAAIGLPIQVR